MTRSLSAIALALSLTLLLVVTVAAHAELESSDPAEGETITTPYTFTATFTEEFDGDPNRSFIRVQNAAGDVVASGGHADQPMTMTAELPLLPPGEYRARWQTTTADDNGVEQGTINFTVEAAPTPAPTRPPAPTPPPGETPTPTETPAPIATPAPAPSPSAAPTEPDGSQTGIGSDVLIALLVGMAIIGAIAFFLVRRSRLP